MRFVKNLEMFAKKLSANRKELSKDLKNRIILSNSNRDSIGKTSSNIKKIIFSILSTEKLAVPQSTVHSIIRKRVKTSTVEKNNKKIYQPLEI